MPYTVGSFASVILFALMFAALRPHFVALREAAIQSNAVIVLRTPTFGYDSEQAGHDLKTLLQVELRSPNNRPV